MKFGSLSFDPVSKNLNLVTDSVREAVKVAKMSQGVFVTAIDPILADTAAFCEAYGIRLESGANCIIVEAKRAERIWYAACVVLATDKLDVNGKVRKQLDARKISFASMDAALELTGMEYGGVTPIGLPSNMSILIDEKVLKQEYVVIGSGLRRSKILVQPSLLAEMPVTTVLDISKEPEA